MPDVAPFVAQAFAKGTTTQAAIDDERFGPYTVFETLGEGGMASVHRAERDGWERNGEHAPIALKRLLADLSEDSQFVEGFLQEARLAKLLDHPNIARSYEHGKIDGQYFMAMEYVPGPTLRAVMIQSRTASGAMPLRIVVEILVQLCDALTHAHGLRDEQGRPLGLVHRDVTPANIILSTSGVVKLIDFGIAKAAHSRVQTQAGYIKGKVSYLAPEYTRGHLDHRADLFAVGVIAHEMLTGRRLFDGESQFSVVGKVREQPIHPPSHHDPQIPHELDDVVMLALQRDPAQRWQNASALRNALAAIARQLGSPVTGKELRAWVEWAFTREPWRDSFVGRILNRLDSTNASQHTQALSPDEIEVIDATERTRQISEDDLLVEIALPTAAQKTGDRPRFLQDASIVDTLPVDKVEIPDTARRADTTRAASPKGKAVREPDKRGQAPFDADGRRSDEKDQRGQAPFERGQAPFDADGRRSDKKNASSDKKNDSSWGRRVTNDASDSGRRTLNDASGRRALSNASDSGRRTFNDESGRRSNDASGRRNDASARTTNERSGRHNDASARTATDRSGRRSNDASGRRRRSYDRHDTSRDNLLDGWSPPTGTALVRPNAPSRSLLPWVLAMLAVVAAAAVLAGLGYIPMPM